MIYIQLRGNISPLKAAYRHHVTSISYFTTALSISFSYPSLSVRVIIHHSNENDLWVIIAGDILAASDSCP